MRDFKKMKKAELVELLEGLARVTLVAGESAEKAAEEYVSEYRGVDYREKSSARLAFHVGYLKGIVSQLNNELN